MPLRTDFTSPPSADPQNSPDNLALPIEEQLDISRVDLDDDNDLLAAGGPVGPPSHVAPGLADPAPATVNLPSINQSDETFGLILSDAFGRNQDIDIGVHEEEDGFVARAELSGGILQRAWGSSGTNALYRLLQALRDHQPQAVTPEGIMSGITGLFREMFPEFVSHHISAGETFRSNETIRQREFTANIRAWSAEDTEAVSVRFRGDTWEDALRNLWRGASDLHQTWRDLPEEAEEARWTLMTFSELSGDTSDIGNLWTKAIEDYCRTTERDIKQFRHLNNTDALLREQEEELSRFSKFRHNGQTTDKLRHLASKDVSADYDVIMTFFDIQHSFLERISIIESKIPTVKAYQTILMRVFSSILALSSIATKYAKEGRFLKWAKALWKGTDEKLKGALDGLNTNIQRLESATMFATLGQTIETHRSVTSIGSAVNENLTVTRQVLASQQETSAVVKEHAQLSQEHFEVTKQMSVTQDKHHNELQKGLGMLFKAYTQSDRDKADQEPGKGEKGRKSRDAGARRSAALAQVKAALQTTANPTMEYAVAEIRHSFVEGTFRWLPENEAYRKFAGGDEEPLLWVTGDRGLGKSSLACFAVDDLRQQRHLYKSTVASFFFKEEHEELRSTVNLLRSVAAQVAESDIKYREEVATEVKKIEDQLRDDDGTLLWERLFASKFPNSSETRLFVVVDGLDEADGDDRKKLLDLFKQIKKDGLQIRVLLTSGPGVLYVEHVLRRLNSLGREAVILKELEKLPDSLSGLYSLLLAECQKGRGDDEFASLKRLFAWLAYSKRPLTLGEASNLVALVNEDAKLSIEEEIDGRSARLLRLAQISSEDEGSSDESGSDPSETADEGLNDDAAADSNTSAQLRFKRGLYGTHLTIFQTIATVLTTDIENDAAISKLKNYAADFWIQHFLDIQVDAASDEEAKCVVESLAAIVTNKGRALEKIEENATSLGIFGDASDLREHTFSAVDGWIKRVTGLPHGAWTPETVGWVTALREDPSKFMEGIARGHVFNWYNHATFRWEAWKSFQFAKHALKLTNFRKEEIEEMGEDPTAEQVLLIANAFPDLEKTSYAHRGIGLVLKWFDHYEAALEECRMSLENPSSVFEQFQALGSVADAAIHLAEQEDDEEKKSAYIKEAREAVNAEADLFPQLGPRCEEKETKAYLANGFSNLAKCALLEDDVEATITVVNERAVPLLPEDSFSYFYFGGITDKLDEKEQHDRLVELFSGFRDKDKLYWLSSYNNKDNHEVFQRAAAKSGKDVGLRYELADYYYRVIGDRGKARELLEQVMESSSKGEVMEEYTLLSTRSHLVELLMEQFRSNVDSSEKASILEEMKKLAFPPDYLLGADFNPHVSNTAIPAALMVRKMGPLLEFQSILNKSFDACIEGLTDAEGWNDSLTIRFFGKLLACLPGLEKDAQIALSSQFYYLNPEFKEQANDSASEASDGEEAGEAGAETTQPDSSTTSEQIDAFKQDGRVGGDPPTGEGLAAADKPSTDDVSLDADIDPECSISCNGCSKEFSSPHQGPIYTCIICTDEDLCADCYNKRISWSQGEPVTDWRTYCGKDHHYVNHAPDGWKEVKDGAVIIADENIEFGEWLKQVQERWAGAWEVFWGKEVDIVDIL
ncbi:glyoxalase bleomycin resistance protein dioxygenase protein [Neofusicoccum parvum]|uniref:Glyoxalase bleomycin resistance protein dioxygenase protein n=1 Tax=Neofusicoccum parvum TaxID=310453 RepID=A0ACB5SKA4_9PEZI|nr:glyoxalase bleomycin resistance protein dioxygenase protein [Neofusicoccum parvum]